MRLTKIICTLGPASNSKEIQRRLIASGMDVARLNLSHGSFEDHLTNLKQIRKLNAELKKNTAVMFDLPGPKLRLSGPINPRVLEKNDQFVLYSGKTTNPAEISINYSSFAKHVKSGDLILINEGRIQLKIIEIKGRKITTRVIADGEIKKGNGVSVPGVDIKMPSVTKRDIKLARKCVENGADWLAQSFIRKASDIAKLRETITETGYNVPIIAKIEKKEAVENINEIIKTADGIMVARGDLGIEMQPEDVPIIQKQIIALAAKAGKPVIIATQMLESMVTTASPTRAEASDVANAIFDQTDAVMLSGETAIGKYPIKSVNVMRRIIEKTEKNIDYEAALKAKGRLVTNQTSDAISYASAELSFDLNAPLIITATQTGNTALQVSKYRPSKPILALSPEEKTVLKLKIAFGVYPFIIKPSKNIDDMFIKAMETATKNKMLKKGQKAVITAGVIVNVPGTTNLIKIQEA